LPSIPLRNDISHTKSHSALYLQASFDLSNNYIMALKIKSFLSTIYKFVIPSIAIAGFVSFIYSLLIYKKTNKFNFLLQISGLFWILLFSRVFLLILVDISSFRAIDYLYFSAAFPILIIASLLSISLLLMQENLFKGTHTSS
jgi:hypothetical protein